MDTKGFINDSNLFHYIHWLDFYPELYAVLRSINSKRDSKIKSLAAEFSSLFAIVENGKHLVDVIQAYKTSHSQAYASNILCGRINIPQEIPRERIDGGFRISSPEESTREIKVYNRGTLILAISGFKGFFKIVRVHDIFMVKGIGKWFKSDGKEILKLNGYVHDFVYDENLNMFYAKKKTGGKYISYDFNKSGRHKYEKVSRKFVPKYYRNKKLPNFGNRIKLTFKKTGFHRFIIDSRSGEEKKHMIYEDEIHDSFDLVRRKSDNIFRFFSFAEKLPPNQESISADKLVCSNSHYVVFDVDPSMFVVWNTSTETVRYVPTVNLDQSKQYSFTVDTDGRVYQVDHNGFALKFTNVEDKTDHMVFDENRGVNHFFLNRKFLFVLYDTWEWKMYRRNSMEYVDSVYLTNRHRYPVWPRMYGEHHIKIGKAFYDMNAMNKKRLNCFLGIFPVEIIKIIAKFIIL